MPSPLPELEADLANLVERRRYIEQRVRQVTLAVDPSNTELAAETDMRIMPGDPIPLQHLLLVAKELQRTTVVRDRISLLQEFGAACASVQRLLAQQDIATQSLTLKVAAETARTQRHNEKMAMERLRILSKSRQVEATSRELLELSKEPVKLDAPVPPPTPPHEG